MLDVLANAQKIPHLLSAYDKFTPALAQARAVKEARPELADQLYAQVEVALLELAAQQHAEDERDHQSRCTVM